MRSLAAGAQLRETKLVQTGNVWIHNKQRCGGNGNRTRFNPGESVDSLMNYLPSDSLTL